MTLPVRARNDPAQYDDLADTWWDPRGGFAMLQYDSRDFIPAPERGTFLMVKQVIYPKGLGNSGKTLYMFMVEAGSCTVTQPYDTGSLDGYSGGWKSFGETPLPEGVTWVVSDGTSTTPLATLTAKNGAQIVE